MCPFCNLTSLSSVDIKIETNSPFCEICQLALAGIREIKIEKESEKKTINAESRNWQSTYAVKHLYDIVRFANCDENTPIFFKPKEGTQTKNRYKNIAVLYYDFINESVDYLNFKVKLTIGIRTDNKHIQYCVNKIEVKEKKSTVPSVTN